MCLTVDNSLVGMMMDDGWLKVSLALSASAMLWPALPFALAWYCIILLYGKFTSVLAPSWHGRPALGAKTPGACGGDLDVREGGWSTGEERRRIVHRICVEMVTLSAVARHGMA